jgi:cobalt-zinc-cadmium efflux system outer membrane protein
MENGSVRWILCAFFLAAVSGCKAYYSDVDSRIEQRAAQPIDVMPAMLEKLPAPMEETKKRASFGQPTAMELGAVKNTPALGFVPVASEKEKTPPAKEQKENEMMKRLEFKESVLGWKIPDIKLPPRNVPEKDYEAAIKKQFPPLPAMPKLPEAQMGPEGRALTLAQLQEIALRMNPKIRQAHLKVEAARGAALQAGLYPNPSFGYEASAIAQGNQDGQRSPGQQGGFVEQTIVTMGKRTLARQAALRDVQIMEQNLRQAESDLQSQVRSGYFAVLSAREHYRVIKGLTELTDELFSVLLAQMRGGEVAAYEPMQIRVLAMQARGTLTLAQNRYLAAWRVLAATLGVPDMPLTALEGRIDMAVPHFEHDQVLAHVLKYHTDVISAQLGVERSSLLVRLAEVQPYPDVTVHAAFQKDYTTPPFGTITNVTVALPFPLYDRNQGNIQAARALWRKAVDDNQRVRNDLTARTAEAFERYDNNRKLLDMYKKDILPNQVQAFRAALARHAALGGVSYNDVVTSQQTLATLINSYLGALNDQWTSVVDISNLLQTNDLFQTQPLDEVAPIPDVYEIYQKRP